MTKIDSVLLFFCFSRIRYNILGAHGRSLQSVGLFRCVKSKYRKIERLLRKEIQHNETHTDPNRPNQSVGLDLEHDSIASLPLGPYPDTLSRSEHTNP